jgi:molybdate transport system ATP-binding protein
VSADSLTLQVAVDFPTFRLQVDERVRLSGVTALFGPSGSGKSTLLRAIAGFERPAAGRIAMAGDVWFDAEHGIDLGAHRRPVGYMFQDARLFPHLSVAGNLRFADRRGRGPGAEYTYDDVVAATEIGGLLGRRVDGLSGGERQRVALARTLLIRPRLLLLDEPLAAIDRSRKADLLPYLEQLPERFRIPALYVSHDIDEVAQLADRILVLDHGRVIHHDAAAAVFDRLDLQPLTGRFEVGSVLEGHLVRQDARLHLGYVDVGGVELAVPLDQPAESGHRVRLRIRARDVALATEPPHGISIRNVLPAVLGALEDQPGTAYVEVSAVLSRGSGAPVRIRARVTRAAVEALGLQVGMPVYVLIKSVSLAR